MTTLAETVSFGMIAGGGVAAAVFVDVDGVTGFPLEVAATLVVLFLCSDLCTTGDPSEVVLFCVVEFEEGGERTVTSPSAWAHDPHPMATRSPTIRYRQLGAVIATVFARKECF
jgi:hypothetical protein